MPANYLIHERARKQEQWIERMQKRHAYWWHDGNPRRPYVALTHGGKISNFYADCTVIGENPGLIQTAAYDLLSYAYILSSDVDAVVGSAYGAIQLACALASELRCKSWFTEKATGRRMLLRRFGQHQWQRRILICEDTITSFETTRQSIAAVRRRAQELGEEVELLLVVLALVNRSRAKEHDGFTIVSLIREDRAREWTVGNNPFTPHGRELTKPLHYKKGNLKSLCKEY